jgi:hypothetical protein
MESSGLSRRSRISRGAKVNRVALQAFYGCAPEDA